MHMVETQYSLNECWKRLNHALLMKEHFKPNKFICDFLESTVTCYSNLKIKKWNTESIAIVITVISGSQP